MFKGGGVFSSGREMLRSADLHGQSSDEVLRCVGSVFRVMHDLAA